MNLRFRNFESAQTEPYLAVDVAESAAADVERAAAEIAERGDVHLAPLTERPSANPLDLIPDRARPRDVGPAGCELAT